MSDAFDWLGRRVSAIEAAAFQRGLDKAVQQLLAAKIDKMGKAELRVALQDLSKQILDSKDE